jgi:hypothetical protein
MASRETTEVLLHGANTVEASQYRITVEGSRRLHITNQQAKLQSKPPERLLTLSMPGGLIHQSSRYRASTAVKSCPLNDTSVELTPWQDILAAASVST